MTKTDKKIPTIEQERLKLLRQYATCKGLISRNKPRFNNITPNKIKENPEYAEKKAEYKNCIKTLKRNSSLLSND